MGAGGRIGRAVVDWLLRHDRAVSAVDRLPAHREHPRLRWYEGDATSTPLIDEAVQGCGAAVHLAGITHWTHGELGHVLGTNLGMTASVVEASVRARLSMVVFASSIQANGVEGNPRVLLPSEYPISTATPSVAVDGYSLSKYYGEDLAQRLAHGSATRVQSLRFPLTLPAADLRQVRAEWSKDPAAGAALGWSYLEVGDAARAVGAALRAEPGGVPLLVAAPSNLLRVSTEDLLGRFAAGVPRRRRFIGDEVPVDLRPVESALGFRAEFEVERGLDERYES